MNARRWLPWVVLWLPACRIDQLASESEVASGSSTLELTRFAEAPPPEVRVRLALSEFAVRRFVWLELGVTVQAAQSLPGQGLWAEWAEGAEGRLESASFDGLLHNELELTATASALSCATGPCAVVLELAPQGSWPSDVTHPLRYRASAALLLERRERLPRDEDLELQLELTP